MNFMASTPVYKPCEIQRILPRHFKMLELKLAGMSHAAIARTLGCTEQNVYIVTRSPLFIGEFNRRMKEQNNTDIQDHQEAFANNARRVLEEASESAAEKQVQLLESEDDSISLRASGSILDRVLGKSDIQSAEAANPTVVINAEHAELLVLALKESNHGTGQEPGSNGSSTECSETRQGDVHQTSEVGSRFGHRKTETQDQREVVV